MIAARLFDRIAEELKGIPIARTNSWLSKLSRQRLNTDRNTVHRVAQLALAIVFVLTAKLIAW